MEFEFRLQQLNPAQRAAVEMIDGPVLVIAGPGTGKTELLGMRVANILRTTDTLPQNILCLTFTESAASNMRDRLSRFIGMEAYNVNISTYHGFGGELIRSYPEYFAETRLQSPIDELGKREIVAQIVEQMSYSNPLKQTQHHLGDLIATISEVKRGLLDSKSLRAVADENQYFIQSVSKKISAIFEDFTTMPRKVEKALPFFEQTLSAIAETKETDVSHLVYQPLRNIAASQLELAIEQANETNKTSTLTAWKNDWLIKNKDNAFILAGELQNKRINALADVLDSYQKALESRGQYDFDDMILRALLALQSNDDLKFTLQERYQYILLDEFQDTNAAQFELVKLLTDNPVHEGRPNVLAVGDDDQAIYAFQGAHYSNMVDFYRQYRDTATINLTQNYRSHPDVLHVAHNVARQIEHRLEQHFESMNKVLEAAGPALEKTAHIERHDFLSDVAEYDWIAREIRAKIDSGVDASEIAVLAPRHKYLEPLVSYLQKYNVAVHYEKREDILATSTIHALKTMSRLVLALSETDDKTANALWPEVLSYEFFANPVSDIWQISWQVADTRGETSWTKLLLDSKRYRETALLFLAIASKVRTISAERALDYLIGTEPIETNEDDHKLVTSPMREYYANKHSRSTRPEQLYEILSHLTVIRSKLRDYQLSQDKPLLLEDFLEFIRLYEESETRMINTSPYHQGKEAVQLMTVFKAKGLEFEYVYLPSCIDEVWGESSRGNTNKLTLPQNLAPIRHAGANQDERLRIFFVAITRAKCGLYMTAPAQSYAGKSYKRLKYLDEQSLDGNSYEARTLPKDKQAVLVSDHDAPELAALESNWRDQHITSTKQTSMQDLLADRLRNYQLSPTHLNNFTDLVFCGPEMFFFTTILRFPSAPTSSGQFGNAIHETLQWYQEQVNQDKRPSNPQTIAYFKSRMESKKLPLDETKLLIERGEVALKAYLSARGAHFVPGNIAEHSFKNEGVFCKDAHLAGKIDLLEIDKEAKTICVVDYKTGKSYDKWASDTKLHKYRQQLYCYKLLIENSHSYKGYTVVGGRLEFVEPDSDGVIHCLQLDFNDKELNRIKDLISIVWKHIKQLDLPDTSKYPPNMTGIRAFEEDLLEKVV